MNRERLTSIFPRASRAFIAANCDPPGPKPQPALRNEPVAKTKRKAGHSGRHTLRITSFRRRLLDPDNLCPKFFIDTLRYAGAIPDDREEDILLQVSQKKVKTQKEENTLIELCTS